MGAVGRGAASKAQGWELLARCLGPFWCYRCAPEAHRVWGLLQTSQNYKNNLTRQVPGPLHLRTAGKLQKPSPRATGPDLLFRCGVLHHQDKQTQPGPGAPVHLCRTVPLSQPVSKPPPDLRRRRCHGTAPAHASTGSCRVQSEGHGPAASAGDGAGGREMRSDPGFPGAWHWQALAENFSPWGFSSPDLGLSACLSVHK